MVLAAERDRPDGALDRVVVELDAAVVEEAAERCPAGQGVADRLGQGAAAGDATELRLEPGLHRLDERPDWALRTALALLRRCWPRIVVSIA